VKWLRSGPLVDPPSPRKKCERDGDSLISWNQFGSANPPVSKLV